MNIFVAEIVLLYVFATFLGALGMRYWIYRNVEDVTAIYPQLEQAHRDGRDLAKSLKAFKEQFYHHQRNTEHQLTELALHIQAMGERLGDVDDQLHQLCAAPSSPAPSLDGFPKRTGHENSHTTASERGLDRGRIARLVERMDSLFEGGEPLGSTARQGDGGGEASRVRWREGTRNLLMEASYGPPDRLRQIAGVGPVLERTLHRIGVFYFWQIAEWGDDDIALVDAHMASFKGRIRRDDWVTQALRLAQAPDSAQRPTPQKLDESLVVDRTRSLNLRIKSLGDVHEVSTEGKE